MQGKNKRGREEINIIDVHGDDQISQVDLMKHMTEEKDTRSFSKKRKDLPSSQQRRKHQITYLAHEVIFFSFARKFYSVQNPFKVLLQARCSKIPTNNFL